MPLRTQYDAVVVGGGHNGLIAATYLAKSGQSVLVLERNAKFGGAVSSDCIFPGVDAAISRYAYLISLLPKKIINDLGVRFSSRRRRMASCTPYEAGGKHRALLFSNSDPAESKDSLLALTSPQDWRGYQRLLSLERLLAELIWPSLLNPLKSRDDWRRSMKAAQEREAWNAFIERPLGEAIENLMEDDVLRGLVFTDAKVGVFTHPHDPSLLQNRCFLLHVVGSGTGEWQVPIGGMGALADELARVAREAGVDLLSDATVESIEVGAPHHTVSFERGTQTSGVRASRVLVNAAPNVLARLLGISPSLHPEDEGSVCKVNLLLRRLPRLKAGAIRPEDAFAGTFHVNETYSEMEMSYNQARQGEVPEKPPFEMYCHTLTDDSILSPSLRRRNYHTLTMFGLDAPYRLFEDDGEQAKHKFLRRYLKALNQVLEDPIEECLARDGQGNLCVEVKSPLDLEHELLLPRGNIFHASPSWFFTDEPEQAGRWGVETAYPRLYLCGSSASRGGGVSGIPGHNTARAILAEPAQSKAALA